MAKKMYKHCFEEVQKLEQDDVIMNLEETEIVPFSFKLSLAKVYKFDIIQVLVEVDEYKDSLILLEKLVEEDETNLDVVYMMAFVNFKL